MDFMKVIVILVKVDEIVQCLEACKPLFIGQEIKIELVIKVFAEVCPWTSIRLLRLSFIMKRALFCKRYSCRECVWYCDIDDTGAG